MSKANGSPMLEVRGLSKHFGSVQAIKDLDFQVKRGEVFGFLGPNGAGKTTTMRIVTCYMPASAGTVLVDGLETVTHDLEVRRKIGYLPENAPLYNDMLVDEYMTFAGEIRGMRGEKLSARVQQMYAVCGLNKMGRRQIGKLSKGFRQRVGLAQAMLHDPDLLILDEPMSGLDPNQIVEIRQLIKKIGEQKTVIYCSHILSEVSATCTRIMIIDEGSIVASGTSTELMSKSSRGDSYVARVKARQGALEGALGSIAGVSSCRIRGSSGEWHEIEIVTRGREDIGEQIFRCIVDNGWALSELKRETASLEDIFTQLTRG
jgi:ABC-2 type transport system ATP-binding protein